MSGPGVGVVLPRDLPAEQVLPYARRADELGFEELWVVEDLGFRGGIAQAAAVLASTTRLRVGIGILPAGARNVAFAAMELGSLAELFTGRLDVGVGHGMPAWMASVGAWPGSPVTLLSEYTAALHSLLHGHDVSGDGRYVRLDDVALEQPPTRVPDILLGVRGPRSLAVAGAEADGTILAEPVTPQYARVALGHVAATRPHRLVAYNLTVVDDDEDAAVAAARPALEWVGEADTAPHLAALPFAEELAALRTQCATRAEFTERMPAAWVRSLALVGSPTTIRARLDELTAAGVTSSVLLPVGDDPSAALENLSRLL